MLTYAIVSGSGGGKPRAGGGVRWSRFKSQLCLFIAVCTQAVLLALVSLPVEFKDSTGSLSGLRAVRGVGRYKVLRSGAVAWSRLPSAMKMF